MPRYHRPQGAYPGEWAFILGTKLVSAVPAHERQIKKREAEAKAEAFADAQNHEGIHELLDKVQAGEITGTDHLHASVTLGLTASTGTRETITPTPTGDGDDDTSVDSDGQSTIDDEEGDMHHSHRPSHTPTATADPALGSGTALPELDGAEVVAGSKPNKGAIAGGVIGALIFLSLLVGLFIFRRRIRLKIISKKYSRMGPTPDPMVITRYVEPKPVMGERRLISTLFGSKSTTSGEGKSNMNLPPPAIIRYSSTTSRRESRNARYIRQDLIRGGDAPGSPPGRGTFYNPMSSSVPGSRSGSPPFRPLSRSLSDRFPIAVPASAVSAPSSTSTSPTITDGFFHALSQPKVPLQAPQPVAIIPAFLIPETPVEPKDSHFSWSTNHTNQVPPTRANPRVSVADSEPRFRGVNSWVNNQRGRFERQDEVRQSQSGMSPHTPAEFMQQPGRQNNESKVG